MQCSNNEALYRGKVIPDYLRNLLRRHSMMDCFEANGTMNVLGCYVRDIDLYNGCTWVLCERHSVVVCTSVMVRSNASKERCLRI